MFGRLINPLTAIVLCLYSCLGLARPGVVGHGHEAPSVNQQVKLDHISEGIIKPAMARNLNNDTEIEIVLNLQDMKKMLKNLENPKSFFPSGVQELIVPGASLWDLAVTSHRTSNAHHNYATSDRAVAQEIALDFFSSALVSCLLADVPINAGRVKRAYTSIHNWPNFINGSPTVKEGIAFMGRAMFRHYYVSDETEEVDIPDKPYTVDVAKNRMASKRLVETWRNVTGNQDFANDKEVKESRLFFELVSYLKNNVYDESLKAWNTMLPIMLEDTELGKWVKETDYHKKLVKDFNDYCKEAPGYEVKDSVAKAHDNDKYIPFNLLAYTLKWYYGDVGIML